MLTWEENELLCRVQGAAPMGALMRRHWVPAVLSEQLAGNDCDPVRVRLFGEDLVAFRDSEGRIGVLGEQCPHRKASLFFGRNEECGLRCLYHGWKFDVDGNVTEMPFAADTKLRSAKYLDNLIEPDHRGVKLRIGPMLGFKRFRTAAITIAGIELSRRIQKNQFNLGRLRLHAGNLPVIWNVALAA